MNLTLDAPRLGRGRRPEPPLSRQEKAAPERGAQRGNKEEPGWGPRASWVSGDRSAGKGPGWAT
jgi:hypothetical protein